MADLGKHDVIVDRAVAIADRPVRLRGYTLEVFGVDASEQLPLLKKLHQGLREVLEISSDRLTIIFHTRAETRRLYANFVDNFQRGEPEPKPKPKPEIDP